MPCRLGAVPFNVRHSPDDNPTAGGAPTTAHSILFELSHTCYGNATPPRAFNAPVRAPLHAFLLSLPYPITEEDAIRRIVTTTRPGHSLPGDSLYRTQFVIPLSSW